ncbi:MAG: pyridoxal phosphate-dependent aminotransferase [Myxococcales bacterium]|nr:pyridoxal phosphate-dependent aminotransferase [Myxococcota bacterium]MDW8282209.1 pyridoxal phosphate-dependent aminotransferase [Myxococcales bacterium]
MNPRLSEIAPSLIRELDARKRPSSIDLGMGEPTLRPDLAPLRAALQWVADHGCPYSPVAGFAELREAIARHHGLPGLDRADNCCVTVGSQQALATAIKTLCDPAADEVLIVAPAYPLYAKLCQLEGVAFRLVCLDPERGFQPEADTVLGALSARTSLVVLASPSNPTGRVWPQGELERLAAGLLRRGRQPYLLSDEVYRDLYYTDVPPPSPARYYPRTLVAGSLSKSCALTGLRLGWLLAPAELMPALLKVHHFAVSCASTVAQQAARAIFAEPGRLEAHRPHYQRQRQVLLEALRAAGLGHVVPEGAFYALVRLSGPWARDSVRTAFALLERKDVVTSPGALFGAEGWLRLSFVASAERLQEGVRRLAELLGERP